MSKINLSQYPNLYNLLTITDVVTTPIIVYSDDSDSEINLTELIQNTLYELTK